MQARRADLLPVGAVVLSAVATTFGVERFVVSEWGLREGALLDALPPEAMKRLSWSFR